MKRFTLRKIFRPLSTASIWRITRRSRVLFGVSIAAGDADLVLGVPATSPWLKRGTLGVTKWRQLFLNSRSVCCRRSLPLSART